jgi:hypothetical protein
MLDKHGLSPSQVAELTIPQIMMVLGSDQQHHDDGRPVRPGFMKVNGLAEAQRIIAARRGAS